MAFPPPNFKKLAIAEEHCRQIPDKSDKKFGNLRIGIITACP
jgi:hypothetical protein